MSLRIKYILILLYFLGEFNSIYGQDLCDSTNPNGISNGFEFLGPSEGCGPFTVKLKNKKTDGTDIKYIYYYQGEGKSQLSSLGSVSETENTYFTPPQKSNYTILQYGKNADGTDFYSCGNVTVNPAKKPVISFNSCNGNFLRINIPINSNNVFDYYEIDWGDGNATEEVSSLPFDGFKSYSTYSATKQISIEGKFNDVLNGCNAFTLLNVNMLEDGNYSNIDQIELDTTLTKVSIDFNGSFANYKFYERGFSNSFVTGASSFDAIPGQINRNTVNGESCFTSFRNFGCLEISGEVCTVPITDFYRDLKNNILAWKEHPTQIINNIYNANSIVDSVIYKMIRYDETDGTKTTFKDPSNPFIDSSACNKPYSYQIEAKIFGTIRGNRRAYQSKSLSQKVLINSNTFHPPAITNLFVSVENDLSIISFQDNSTWDLLKNIYYIHQNSISGANIIDSTYSPEKIVLAINAKINSNCFFITYKDECESVSESSPEVCTLYLETDGNKEINWDLTDPFSPNSIGAYEILAQNEITGNKTSIFSEIGFSQGKYQPNLDGFDKEATFYIRGINSEGLESYSNSVTIPIQSKLYIPDAFSPNGDGLNDTFQVFGNIRSSDFFEIYVYNRWGQIIFYSTDPGFNWDGTFNSEKVPSGIYPFSIATTNLRNEGLSKRGTVSIK